MNLLEHRCKPFKNRYFLYKWTGWDDNGKHRLINPAVEVWRKTLDKLSIILSPSEGLVTKLKWWISIGIFILLYCQWGAEAPVTLTCFIKQSEGGAGALTHSHSMNIPPLDTSSEFHTHRGVTSIFISCINLFHVRACSFPHRGATSLQFVILINTFVSKPLSTMRRETVVTATGTMTDDWWSRTSAQKCKMLYCLQSIHRSIVWSR